ncbi:adenylosuccinate lyase [Candidatus Roizmanbacteria bacterium RIFCSPLOWO2_01_FULL_38_12]|uniref:Adenylosuccinate lyase n=1 Tax=Candidatus Roizmanbacteria bacterium RIFCSPLOWO2_01_FULL_38_12 TaxID=1802061 RepID=A0A1F7J113_9BACT|nr:MAG: adenylosuccinate lyase [Candidatus Roizmanbacteria bacterium RIFCSPHIGHO2_01_FULL_38_15]OGK35741.1 MAG: adenylosuccinate lyase [Candidatus Roizmanbacteria bacterium RIFCSPHIGHO2_12_FULL_38_13]OGK49305.1 MAG: adenylosuccinate lyase [Candidatus Roizmanbacteria bacterium RIFCSPLOWO2_01_FULL_38_12]
MDFKTFISPFSWRYGSPEMRHIFSEEYKYQIWRKIWVSLAKTQHKAGLVSTNELKDLEKNQNKIDIDRILEIEKETHHDVVATIKEYAEKAKVGGGKIHLGATSMDIVDNADTIKMKEALEIVERKLIDLLKEFSKKIEKYASLPCIGFTHLQPAEPTTVGYRFAFYAQDLLLDFEYLQFVKKIMKGKGLKGAVGTSASYTALLKNNKMSAEKLEDMAMKKLGIDPLLVTSQVSTRKLDYFVLNLLSSTASSLSKFAADLRILQSPMYGEWSEPFGKKQVGSSAMPFKKNPINCEKICSLARYIDKLPSAALENATHSYLERTLDDSANRRIIIPEAFLAIDEIMKTAGKILDGMIINELRIKFNLMQFSPFAATEAILMQTVKQGANRLQMHETLREISLVAWKEIQEGKQNRMIELLKENKTIKKFLSEEEIIKLLDASSHIGNASERALKLTKQIKKIINTSS